ADERDRVESERSDREDLRRERTRGRVRPAAVPDRSRALSGPRGANGSRPSPRPPRPPGPGPRHARPRLARRASPRGPRPRAARRRVRPARARRSRRVRPRGPPPPRPPLRLPRGSVARDRPSRGRPRARAGSRGGAASAREDRARVARRGGLPPRCHAALRAQVPRRPGRRRAADDPLLRVPGSVTLAGIEALVADPDPLRARTGYDLALWIVHDLLDRGGTETMRELLDRLAAGDAIDDATLRVYGLRMAEIESQ